jgi:hypothetical protein
MLFGRVLRWSCDARQLAALRQVREARWAKRRARKDAERLYDLHLGDGPNGPDSWQIVQFTWPAYLREVAPINRRADVARRQLAVGLRECRDLKLARWQIRLALF